MNYNEILEVLGKTDIYVIDQILKGRYQDNATILDAGCGGGRNLRWFYQNDFTIFGIDSNPDFLAHAKEFYPNAASNFSMGTIEKMPYEQNSFDHIICSAVLHFAESEEQFLTMFSELIRVLKVDGTILIRMASDIGLDGKSPQIKYSKTGEKGNYYLKRDTIIKLNADFEVEQIEPTKTTNVDDLRSMTTLMFQKTVKKVK